jgi:3-hydroxy-9,10-secoandrosta-1,3,5(10)-triene-9,17-dione monooxygenase
VAARRVAEAAAELDCARWLLVGSARETMAILARGETPGAERRILNRRNQAEATLLACGAVDRIFGSAGGSAIYLSNRLQRVFRDVHAGAAHFSLSFDFAAAPYGQLRLGAEPDPASY